MSFINHPDNLAILTKMKGKVIGFVYQARNKINGKIYIGATTHLIENRRKDHEQKAESGHGHQFHEAIATYGPEAFEWQQIDSANTLNELAEKERQYILKYDSVTAGYNGDGGGGFKKKIYRYRGSDGRLVATYDSLTEAAEATNSHKGAISNACLGYSRTCCGDFWSYRKAEYFQELPDLRKKQVLQFALDGYLINRFESVAVACRQTGINQSSIAKVCRGERNHAGGFRWKYEVETNEV